MPRIVLALWGNIYAKNNQDQFRSNVKRQMRDNWVVWDSETVAAGAEAPIAPPVSPSELNAVSPAPEWDYIAQFSSDVHYRLRYNDMHYAYMGPAIERLLGYSPHELQHMQLRELIVEARIIEGDEGGAYKTIEHYDAMERNRRAGVPVKWEADYWMRCKDGRMVWVNDVSYPWVDTHGRVIGSVGVMRDITARVGAEQRARKAVSEPEHLMQHDEATGLPNCEGFTQKLNRMILEENDGERANPSPISVASIEIDSWEKRSEGWSEVQCDAVASAVAGVLQEYVEREDVLARIDAKTFAVIFPATRRAGAQWVCERICGICAEHSFTIPEISELPLHFTLSIGVAGNDEDAASDGNKLYNIADNRLYIAKHTGANKVSVDEMMA